MKLFLKYFCRNPRAKMFALRVFHSDKSKFSKHCQHDMKQTSNMQDIQAYLKYFNELTLENNLDKYFHRAY